MSTNFLTELDVRNIGSKNSLDMLDFNPAHDEPTPPPDSGYRRSELLLCIPDGRGMCAVRAIT